MSEEIILRILSGFFAAVAIAGFVIGFMKARDGVLDRLAIAVLGAIAASIGALLAILCGLILYAAIIYAATGSVV